MASESSNDCDWFDRDEDEILESIQSNRQSYVSDVEFITGPCATDEKVKELTLSAARNSDNNKNQTKLPLSELQKISEMETLDAFLYTYTYQRNFFVGQFGPDDGLLRVSLYMNIIRKIINLELPGFTKELIESIISDEFLLNNYLIIFTKLFSKIGQSLWNNDENVQSLAIGLTKLVKQAYLNNVMTTQFWDLLHQIKELIVRNRNTFGQNVTILALVRQLEKVLDNPKIQDQKPNQVYSIGCNNKVYPSHKELMPKAEETERITNLPVFKTPENVNDYIANQKQLLREDFVLSLCTLVQEIKATGQAESFPHVKLYNKVTIVANEEFLNAQRHQIIFADILSCNRSGEASTTLTDDSVKELRSIKVGALLCFSTSTRFENLIWATVNYTDEDMQRSGYIGIEVLEQYNIGNIFDKQFIMFESPAFFEPYSNVFNCLKNFSLEHFPMEPYLVHKKTEPKIVNYLPIDAVYTYNGIEFKLNQDEPQNLPKNLPLNSSQVTAFCNALRHELCLIQGPPGTGKTHCSVQLVKTLIENCPKPIVLITYTNESLDKFLINVSRYTNNIVRFGFRESLKEVAQFSIRNASDRLVNPRLKRLYYLKNVEFKAKFSEVLSLQKQFDGSDESYQQILCAQSELQAIRQKLDTIRLMFQYYVAREKDIIAMTTTYAAKTNFLFRLLKSRLLIFEEAAEIPEAHIVACFTTYTEHVIMFGDHMQLHPYTSNFNHNRSSELNISLFERLINQKMKYSKLDIQYRMRPCIANLLHPIIYATLRNDPSVEQYPPVPGMQKNLYFQTHTLKESKMAYGCSFYNKAEAKEILKLADHLCSNGCDTKDIVVLSPYMQQVELIKETFRHTQLKDMRVATVDTFQGLEAKVVLLSLVRSNECKQIGFLRERNRICVALSRARHGMYIVGNMALLASCSTTWQAIKERLDEQQAIGDHFPYQHDNSDFGRNN